MTKSGAISKNDRSEGSGVQQSGEATRPGPLTTGALLFVLGAFGVLQSITVIFVAYMLRPVPPPACNHRDLRDQDAKQLELWYENALRLDEVEEHIRVIHPIPDIPAEYYLPKSELNLR